MLDTIAAIVAAEFVLAGALHAAVVACAYDVPFAYYDSGDIDLPFKCRKAMCRDAAKLNPL